MRERWEPGFDVYGAGINGKPAVFVVDLAARQHAPVASHPLRVQVRIAVQRPLSNGLRDASEAPALGQAEDALVPALEAKLDAIYVGRFVSDGHVTFVFYVPALFDGRDLSEFLPDLAPYEPMWLTDDDPEWRFYDEFLHPDDRSMQIILNRRLLDAFREGGDDLAQERVIDHVVFLPDEKALRAASRAFAKAGFDLDEPVKTDDGSWQLEMHRKDRLSDGRPDEFTVEILDVLEEYGGTYDGWGAVHVDEKPKKKKAAGKKVAKKKAAKSKKKKR